MLIIKKEDTWEQDEEVKAFAQKIVPSKLEDLSKVIKQIITESNDEFLMACKRTVLEQWSDILNKFDEILEKIISKSNLLSFGEKSPSKKQKQALPSKEQKPCQKTPHTEMILSILEMSLMIVKNTKIGYSQYSSLDRLTYLLNSENLDILHQVLQICLLCFKKNSMISKGVVEHTSTFVHKLNFIAKGYGKDSTQFCYDETISDETLKLGTSIKFKVVTEDLDHDFRSEEIQEEVVIEDVKKSAPDALTLWNDLIKKEGSIVAKLNNNKKFDLWTRIRMAYAFYNLETRRKFLVSRFNSFSVLLYISKKDLLSLEIVPELSKCMEKDKRGELKLPKEVAISMLEFYISLSVFKSSRIQTAALQTLTLTTNTYSGLLQSWLQKLINIYVNGEPIDPSDYFSDKLYLETLLDLFVSISRTANGSKHLADSGIANEITSLLFAKDELVVMKCIAIVELFLDPKSGVQTSPTVLSDCIKLFSDIIEVSQPKVAKLVEENTEKTDGSSNTTVFKLLSPYLSPTLSSVLRIISSAYLRPETTNTEILEERQMNSINFIIKNYTWFGPINFSCITDLIHTLISKDVANISIIRGFGTVDLILDIARNGLPPYAKVLHNVLRLINSLCLNQDFREKLAQDDTFYSYLQIFLNEKYSKAIKKDVGFSIGSEFAALSKSYPTLKESVVNAVVKIMNELLEKLQQTNLEDGKDVHPIFMLASQFVLTVGIIVHDSTTLFIDKGFFPILLKITELSLVPSTQIIEPMRYIVVFKDLIRSHSSLVYEGLSELLISKLGSLNSEELDFGKFSTIKNIFTLTTIIEIMSSCFEQSEDSFVEVWKNKKTDVLTDLAHLESKVRLYIAKSKSQILKDEISSLKKKKPIVAEEKSLDTSTTSISSSSSTTSTEIKTPVEETQEEISARSLRKFNNSTINSYLTLIFRFYQSLQRAIFDLVENDGSTEALLKAKEVANLLTQNFSVSVAEAQKIVNDETLSWTIKATHVHTMMSLIYSVVISENYRNLNTLLLDTMLSKGVIDSIMKLYSDTVNLVLSQDVKKPSKQDVSDPIFLIEHESSDYGTASSCLEDCTAFLQKITSGNYSAQSPITTKLFALEGFKVAELTTKVQKKVAGAVVKVWNHVNIDQGSATFLVCLINVVGHIIKGCDTSKKETSPVKEDEDMVNQLMEMGFTQKDARAALRGSNNDVMVAAEWILSNSIPKEASEEEDEEEEEDELSKAIRMSMVESGMMNDVEEDKTDYSLVIEEEADKWLTLRVFTKGLTFACIDVFGLLVKKKEAVREYVVNAAIEKLTNDPSNVQNILAIKSMLENADFRSLLVNRRHEFLGVLLSTASNLVENSTTETTATTTTKEENRANLATILKFFVSLFKQKHLKDAFTSSESGGGAGAGGGVGSSLPEKMTVEKLENKLQGITLTEDVDKVLELCFAILQNKDTTPSTHNAQSVASELLANLTSTKEASIKLFNSPLFELALKFATSEEIEQILLNIVCEKDNTKSIMKNILKRRHPKVAGSRLTLRMFLAENVSLIERNPTIFFELVKEMFQINRNRFIELKDSTTTATTTSPSTTTTTEESTTTTTTTTTAQPPSSQPTTTESSTTTAKNLLFKLLSLIVANPKESKTYLEVLGTFVNACDLYDSLAEYTNDNLDSNMKGENKLIYFLLTGFTNSGVIYLLIEICAKKPHLVLGEVSNILQTESSHKVLQQVCAFLVQLAISVSNPNQLASLMIKYDILRLLIASSERIDINKEASMHLILSVVQKLVESSPKNYIITKPPPSVVADNVVGSSSSSSGTTSEEQVDTLELTRDRPMMGLNRI